MVKNTCSWYSGGAHLYSQLSGGRGRRISKFSDSLVYIASFFWTARATQRNPASKKIKKIEKKI